VTPSSPTLSLVAFLDPDACQDIAQRFRIDADAVDYWARVAAEEGMGSWPPIEPQIKTEFGWTPEAVHSFIRELLAAPRA